MILDTKTGVAHKPKFHGSLSSTHYNRQLPSFPKLGQPNGWLRVDWPTRSFRPLRGIVCTGGRSTINAIFLKAEPVRHNF